MCGGRRRSHTIEAAASVGPPFNNKKATERRAGKGRHTETRPPVVAGSGGGEDLGLGGVQLSNRGTDRLVLTAAGAMSEPATPLPSPSTKDGVAGSVPPYVCYEGPKSKDGQRHGPHGACAGICDGGMEEPGMDIPACSRRHGDGQWLKSLPNLFSRALGRACVRACVCQACASTPTGRRTRAVSRTTSATVGGSFHFDLALLG